MSFVDAPQLPPELLRNAKVLPDREHIIDFIEPEGVFVEIGVAFGDFTRFVLDRCRPRRLVAIDLFDLERHTAMWGKPMRHWLGAQTHAQFYGDRFAADIVAGRLQMLIGDGLAQITRLADCSVNSCYIDAGHGYEEVKAQLLAAEAKLRPTGLMILNDYTYLDVEADPPAPYGVIRAAHEFMIERDWELIYLALHPQMYCDIAVRRRDPR